MKFTVSGMTCGGCIKAITKAIQSVDDQAQFKIDLVFQTIELETQLSSDEAQQLIADAGFPIVSTH
jgi:copper chaperone